MWQPLGMCTSSAPVNVSPFFFSCCSYKYAFFHCAYFVYVGFCHTVLVMGAFAPNAIKCLESVSFLWPPFLLLLNFWLLFPFSKLLNLSLLFKKKQRTNLFSSNFYPFIMLLLFFLSRFFTYNLLCICFVYVFLLSQLTARLGIVFFSPSIRNHNFFFCFEIYARQPGCREINVWHGHRNKILKSVIICKFFNKKKFFPSLRFFYAFCFEIQSPRHRFSIN